MIWWAHYGAGNAVWSQCNNGLGWIKPSCEKTDWPYRNVRMGWGAGNWVVEEDIPPRNVFVKNQNGLNRPSLWNALDPCVCIWFSFWIVFGDCSVIWRRRIGSCLPSCPRQLPRKLHLEDRVHLYSAVRDLVQLERYTTILVYSKLIRLYVQTTLSVYEETSFPEI